jgi:predicted ABC-type ATPase
MPGFNPLQPRDQIGRWTDQFKGSVPDYILKKIDANVSNREDMEQRIIDAKKNRKDSLGMYQDEDGNLTPERQALHDKIVEHFVSQGKLQTGHVYILGGPPANGKTSLEESGFLPYPTDQIVGVNPDKIKEMLPEYKFLMDRKKRYSAAFVHEESSLISKKIINRSLAERKDFIIDGIGDGGLDVLAGKLSRYKAAGNRVVGNYVSLDTDLSVKLAEARGKKSGRYVPRSYLLEMNREISNLVPKLMEGDLFDELTLWDTNINGQPRKVASKKGRSADVHDATLYKNFLDKAKK